MRAARPGRVDQAQARHPGRRQRRRGGVAHRDLGLPRHPHPVDAVPSSSCVALLVTQLLARGMTSPLREMTAAARGMATGDYARRVTATSQRRGRRAGPGVQHDGRRPGRGGPAAARPGRQRLARAAHPGLRAAGRAGEPRRRRRRSRTRRPCRPRSARPSGSAGWSPTCWTCPASTPASRRWPRDRCPASGSSTTTVAEARLSRRPVTYVVRRRPGRPHGARGPVPAAPAGRQPPRQRRPAQPAGRHRHRRGPARPATAPSSRSPTRARASPRTTAPRCSSASPPAAPTGPAAPASAWPSPGGSPSCTAAASRSPSPTGPATGCRIRATLPGGTTA